MTVLLAVLLVAQSVFFGLVIRDMFHRWQQDVEFLTNAARTDRKEILDRLTVALEKPRPVLREDLEAIADLEGDQPTMPPWFDHIGDEVEAIPKEWNGEGSHAIATDQEP